MFYSYNILINPYLGQGMEIPIQEVYRGISYEIELLKRVRLEIAVNDEFVQNVLNAI